jgi:predicted amidohydrolase
VPNFLKMEKKEKISVLLVQIDLISDDYRQNLSKIENFLALHQPHNALIILPEMFSTGFTMSPETLLDPSGHEAIKCLQTLAKKYTSVIAGSCALQDQDKYYNRFLWVLPNGQLHSYDKKHLFAYAGEDKAYTPGDKRVIVSLGGWRFLVQICYDLRFPVWARNKQEEYDAIIYVANWPAKRDHAWRTLLQARAIENQSYVLAVNRIGSDQNDLQYMGHSGVIDPQGNWATPLSNQEVGITFALEASELNAVRQQLPFLKDADDFLLL